MYTRYCQAHPHRHQCLIDRDVNTNEYMPNNLMVFYNSTKNLINILVRAKVPQSSPGQGRVRPVGFKKCGRKDNFALCVHSEPDIVSSYTWPVTNQIVEITSPITYTQCVFLAFNHLVMLPIEKISGKDAFIREDFYIKKFDTQKKLTISEIEHGLNLHRGK